MLRHAGMKRRDGAVNTQDEQRIAQRVLTIEESGARIDVPVTIFKPSAADKDWRCAYEIGWPAGARRREIFGIDAVQAILLAMQAIGAELYAAASAQVDLQWLEPEEGFGFPVAEPFRERAKGEDRHVPNVPSSQVVSTPGREAAAGLVDLLLRHSRELNGALLGLQDRGEDADLQAARQMIGRILGETYVAALYPIFDKYPDLKPEGFP